jgi:hypothetical protein
MRLDSQARDRVGLACDVVGFFGINSLLYGNQDDPERTTGLTTPFSLGRLFSIMRSTTPPLTCVIDVISVAGQIT